MWMQGSSQSQSTPTHSFPLHKPAVFIVFSALSLVLGFVAINSGSKTNGFGFWARRFSLIVWVGTKCMAQSWAAGERRGLGYIEILSPQPGPCSLQKPSLPTTGPPSPSPSHSNSPEMVMQACRSLTALDHISSDKLSSFLVMPTSNVGIMWPKLSLATPCFWWPWAHCCWLGCCPWNMGAKMGVYWDPQPTQPQPHTGSQKQRPRCSQGYVQTPWAIPGFNLSPQVRSPWRWRIRQLFTSGPWLRQGKWAGRTIAVCGWGRWVSLLGQGLHQDNSMVWLIWPSASPLSE